MAAQVQHGQVQRGQVQRGQAAMAAAQGMLARPAQRMARTCAWPQRRSCMRVRRYCWLHGAEPCPLPLHLRLRLRLPWVLAPSQVGGCLATLHHARTRMLEKKGRAS